MDHLQLQFCLKIFYKKKCKQIMPDSGICYPNRLKSGEISQTALPCFYSGVQCLIITICPKTISIVGTLV